MADYYTAEKIVTIIRSKLADTVEPYLLSDDDLVHYIDEAQREYAERTLCMRDATTYTVSVTADDPWITVDPRILHIREGYLQTSRRTLKPITLSRMSGELFSPDYGQLRVGWRTTTGTPEYMITDIQEGAIRLAPIPVASETLEFVASLYPADFTDVDDALTLPDRDRRDLPYGVLMRVYGMQDSELFDPQAEAKNRSLWELAISRGVERHQKFSRGAGNVRFNNTGVW